MLIDLLVEMQEQLEALIEMGERDETGILFEHDQLEKIIPLLSEMMLLLHETKEKGIIPPDLTPWADKTEVWLREMSSQFMAQMLDQTKGAMN